MAKKEREMQKFNGKVNVPEGAETITEASSKKSNRSGSPKRGYSPGLDDIDEAANMKYGDNFERSGLRLHEVEGDDYDRNALDDDEALEDEAMRELKRKEENPLKELFKDPENNYAEFDPNKRFGIIEDKGLIYDNVTTSYPVNLPTDYYQKYIN